jgi:hypothetical protein
VMKQSSLGVEEVFDMDQELTLCFFDVVGALQHLANFGQWENCHHQSVVPELLRVWCEVTALVDQHEEGVLGRRRSYVTCCIPP